MRNKETKRLAAGVYRAGEYIIRQVKVKNVKGLASVRGGMARSGSEWIVGRVSLAVTNEEIIELELKGERVEEFGTLKEAQEWVN